ncbi:hypothetical protein BX600DRAFT_512439 [Xylariales sp. PMI_506]|nr:hypothetical protein BX600DRAFT_512439 [Xylariales sp. PMI_506]
MALQLTLRVRLAELCGATHDAAKLTGRPATSCAGCRQRRIKCGKQRPRCLQCKQASIECPGYRPVATHFKDETQLTAEKVQSEKRGIPKRDKASHAVTPSRGAVPVQKQACDLTYRDHRDHREHRDLVTSSLQTPINDTAISFLGSRYLQASLLSQVAPLYLQLPDSDTAITAAVHAAALAALAMETQQPKMLLLARSEYSRAIRNTQRAIQDPAECTTDATLAAVIHLGLYEAIAFDERRSPNDWTAHMHGALALLKQRGVKQLATPIGRELYIIVVQSMRASCVQRQVVVPQELVDMDNEASKYIDPYHPAYQLRTVMDTLAHIRAQRSRASVTPREVVEACVQLDSTLSSLMERVRKSAKYTVVPPAQASDTAFQRCQQWYPSLAAAKTWNSLRLLRLFVNIWIQQPKSGSDGSETSVSSSFSSRDSDDDDNDDDDDYAQSDSEEDALLQFAAVAAATQRAEAMALGILASVPQFLSSSCSGITSVARFWILPLAAIAEEALLPEPMREYAREYLKLIGLRGGIPLAVLATAMVNESRPMEDW